MSLTDVPQLPKKKVDDEESTEFQKLSLTDVPPQPQVPKNGKPAGDFLYHNITKCLAPETFSPYLLFLNNRPEVVMIIDDKPKKIPPKPFTWSPSSNPPDWAHEWDYKLPENVEQYAFMRSSIVATVMSTLK